jgi:mycothiol synthase
MSDRGAQEAKMHPKHDHPLPGLPEGYAVRAPEADELRAVFGLIGACDLAEYAGADLAEEELRADWEDPRADRWIVISPEGEVVGYGSLSRPGVGEPKAEAQADPARYDVECYVRPEHAGKGIGRHLLRLAEARALERLVVGPGQVSGAALTNTVNGANAAARGLLESEGYSPVRHFLRMAIDLRGAPTIPELPPGVTIHPCLSGEEERVALAVAEEAFRDHWGHAEGTLSAWCRRRGLAGSGHGRWLVAKAGDEAAGAVFLDLSPGEETGEVEWLAVRRPWRRRGLGLALLRAAFSEIRARGGREACLVVDLESPTGAGRLYERAGMRIVRHYAVHRKALRPTAG